MATKTTKNTKKSVSQKPIEEKVDVNSTNDLVEENASLKKELEEMMSNYKDMQMQLQNILLAQQAQALSAKGTDDTIIVGCRIFNGVTLSSIGGDISISIQNQEEVETSYTELREIFKSPFNYKNMFKKGILYFVNPDDYTRFSIKPEIDLSDENLVDLLSNNTSHYIIEYCKKITNDKKDLMEMFALIYQIARLIDGKKVDLDYEIRSNLEKYFNIEFTELINNLHQ